MLRVSVDLETGGTEPAVHPCLAIGYVVVTGTSLRILEKGEILVKADPQDCLKSALAVNKIDLKHHNKKALTPKRAVCQFDAILRKHFGDEHPQIMGQNPEFDIKFLSKLYEKTGRQFKFSYRIVDLMVFWRGLSAIGLVNSKSAGLDSILDYLKLPEIGQRHSALIDAMNVVRVFRYLRRKIGRIEIDSRLQVPPTKSIRSNKKT